MSKTEEKQMIQFQENTQTDETTDGRMDRRTCGIMEGQTDPIF